MPIPFRCYLDTDVLVSAILESDPNWQKKHSKDAQSRAEKIQASEKVLFSEYLYAEKPKTSVFAISEFISKGRTERFGKKTFGEMYDIVSKEVSSRCEIINAEISQQGLPKIDSQWEKYWMFANISCNAETIDRRNNQPLGPKDLTFIYSLTQAGVHSSIGFGGSLPLPEPKYMKIVKFNSIQCSAPAFEILLFTKASEIANEYDIHLGDAIHVLYAQGNAEHIITNDSDFYKKWNDNPSFRGKSGLIVESSVNFVKWCTNRKWL